MKTDQPIACAMATPTGRITRIVAGIVLIVVGILVTEVVARYVLIVVGIVVISAGVFNFCGIAPLLGAPFFGKKLTKKS
jgi:hypothetical protein